MPEPVTLTVLTSISGAARAGLTCSSFVLSLKNCPEDVKTCFNLVKRVWEDVHYAVHLRTKHRGLLLERQTEAARIDSVLQSAILSVQDIGTLVERARVDISSQKIDIVRRLRWVTGDSSSFATRTRNLQAQQMAVLAEITYLRNLDMIEPLTEALSGNTSFENIDLLQAYSPGDKNSNFSLPAFPAILRPQMHTLGSCDTLVGSNYEEFVTQSFQLDHCVHELEAGVVYEIPEIDGNSKLQVRFEERELGEEDLEGAFFQDWKSQEEEYKERSGPLGNVLQSPVE